VFEVKNSTYNVEFCQEVIPLKGTRVQQGRPELNREDILHAQKYPQDRDFLFRPNVVNIGYGLQ